MDFVSIQLSTLMETVPADVEAAAEWTNLWWFRGLPSRTRPPAVAYPPFRISSRTTRRRVVSSSSLAKYSRSAWLMAVW